MENKTWQESLFAGGMLTDAAVDTAAGHHIATQLAHWLNGPNTTVYDKAIDSVYLQTHVGGASLHHLLDGQHDICGAFHAAADALPNDSLWQEVAGTAHHLGKDLFSASGVPLFSLEPQTYHQASTWMRNTMHLPKSWLGDLLQVNGLELFSGLLASAAVVLGYRQADIGRLAELGGASGLAGVLSANPLAMAAAAVALVLAWKGRGSAAPIGKGILIGTGATAAVHTVGAGLGLIGAGCGLLPSLACIAVSMAVGLYARNLLARQLGITTAPQLPPASRDAAWQMPDVLRATVDARRAMFDFPADISPEISAAINHRLRSL